ncbi:MAG: hypothetical protein ACR2JB_14690, partial [Bryobacteraceae bacterium]
LVGPVPTIGDTLLHQTKFAKNDGEKLHVFENGSYRDHGLSTIRKTGRELMCQWGAAKQWKKGLADEVHEWVLLA